MTTAYSSIFPLLIYVLLRLASIENAQREACCGAKREEFLRFTRRKWLASDLAAEKLQRVFRGHIGRRRAELVAEVRRLNGQARAEWIEVSFSRKRNTKPMLAGRFTRFFGLLKGTESVVWLILIKKFVKF